MTESTPATTSPGLPSNSASPPRKRPRTRAPPQAAASASTTTTNDTPKNTEIPSPQHPNPATDAPVHRFSIQPLNRFRGASATIKRPREVANFSYDDNHEYQADESGINYYIPPPMGADLKGGFETFRHYEEKEDPHLDSLLRALMEDSQGKGEVKADFMTWRGMMTKVC
jgi:RAT1-interacting protein